MKVTAALAFVGAAAAVEYSTWSSPNGIEYSVSIPDAAAAPFDVALKIVAPATIGWAGIAWGGSMLNNPLIVAWANGEDVVASPRVAPGYMMPRAYADMTLTKGPDNMANSTHWVLDVVCTGCSKWSGGALDPSSAAQPLAWAFAAKAPMQPASADSNFGYHDNKGRFTIDLAAAKSADFEEAFAPAPM